MCVEYFQGERAQLACSAASTSRTACALHWNLEKAIRLSTLEKLLAIRPHKRSNIILGTIAMHSQLSVASLVLLFISFDLCISTHTVKADINHANASDHPRILHPSSGAILNNIKILVSVTGHDSWHEGSLLLVLDHGVQGLPVPISGNVDLGIVASGRFFSMIVPAVCMV